MQLSLTLTSRVLTLLQVIDCEGCIDYLFRGNNVSLCEMLRPVRLIFLEGDMGTEAPDCSHDCVDYPKWCGRGTYATVQCSNWAVAVLSG